MATVTTVQLIDDLTGEPAEETIHFGVDSHAYEIDLTAHNAGMFRDILGDYIRAARKLPSAGRRSTRSPDTTVARVDPIQRKAIRAWARAAGHDVGDRGRIPEKIITAYQAHAGRRSPVAV